MGLPLLRVDGVELVTPGVKEDFYLLFGSSDIRELAAMQPAELVRKVQGLVSLGSHSPEQYLALAGHVVAYLSGLIALADSPPSPEQVEQFIETHGLREFTAEEMRKAYALLEALAAEHVPADIVEDALAQATLSTTHLSPIFEIKPPGGMQMIMPGGIISLASDWILLLNPLMLVYALEQIGEHKA